VSAVVQNLCARRGTKIFITSPYAPQTDGMVERFHAKLCRDLTKFVTHEEDRDRHLAFAVFRYNSSCNEATGVSPFRALFDVDQF
jgi:transposase InsO family protein